ncbi:hypothetical protein PENSPDRAFT_752164 [Peniophora sp. CONT]|nr:hypothetical protein PENSPDRAFT_752164 [Peniophora sp. CONT]
MPLVELDVPASSDLSDQFWSLYLSDAEKHDRLRAERWKGDMDGILIFTGLFAATVAAFVVYSLPTLSPDPDDQTLLLLQALVALSNSSAKGAQIPVNPSATSFQPSSSEVWTNALWFMSLSVALVSALSAALVQQWARLYTRDVHLHRGRPTARGKAHSYLSQGIHRFKLEYAIIAVVCLLFAGLVVLLFSVNKNIAIALSAFLSIFLSVYLILSALPLAFPNAPYNTPLTPVLMATQFVFGVLIATTRRLSATVISYTSQLFMVGGARQSVYSDWSSKIDHPHKQVVQWKNLRGARYNALKSLSRREQLDAGLVRFALGELYRFMEDLEEVDVLIESLRSLIYPNVLGRTSLDILRYLVTEVHAFDLACRLLASCLNEQLRGRVALQPLTDTRRYRRIANALSFIRMFFHSVPFALTEAVSPKAGFSARRVVPYVEELANAFRQSGFWHYLVAESSPEALAQASKRFGDKTPGRLGIGPRESIRQSMVQTDNPSSVRFIANCHLFATRHDFIFMFLDQSLLYEGKIPHTMKPVWDMWETLHRYAERLGQWSERLHVRMVPGTALTALPKNMLDSSLIVMWPRRYRELFLQDRLLDVLVWFFEMLILDAGIDDMTLLSEHYDV